MGLQMLSNTDSDAFALANIRSPECGISNICDDVTIATIYWPRIRGPLFLSNFFQPFSLISIWNCQWGIKTYVSNVKTFLCRSKISWGILSNTDRRTASSPPCIRIISGYGMSSNSPQTFFERFLIKSLATSSRIGNSISGLRQREDLIRCQKSWKPYNNKTKGILLVFEWYVSLRNWCDFTAHGWSYGWSHPTWCPRWPCCDIRLGHDCSCWEVWSIFLT